MDFPDQGREDMGGFEVIVVVGTIEVGGHDRDEIAAILPVITFTHLDAGNLGNGVGLVGLLQESGKQVLLLYRLCAIFRIDAGAPQEEKFFNPGNKTLVNDVVLDLQVFVNELCTKGIIRHNASHLGSGQDHVFRTLRFKELLYILLPGKIKFFNLLENKVGVSLVHQSPVNG